MFEEFCQMQCVTADTEYIYMIFLYGHIAQPYLVSVKF